MLLRSIGNDIVDLDESRRPPHPRFVQRVFGVAERAFVAESPERMWLHWAAKEAAYKALNRIDPQIAFSPVRFEFDYSNGWVEYEAYRLPCRCRMTPQYVSVVCATDQAMLRGDRLRSWVSPVVEQVPSNGFSGRASSALSEESQAVRMLALGEIASLSGIDLDLLEVCTLAEAHVPRGVSSSAASRRRLAPRLKVRGRISEDLLSFSHDGRFVMCSYYALPMRA